MSTGPIPDATPADVEVKVRLGGEMQLCWSEGQFRLRHLCDRSASGRNVIICAPVLSQHFVQWVPEAGYTVQPSILCPDCGLHGWIRANEWQPA